MRRALTALSLALLLPAWLHGVRDAGGHAQDAAPRTVEGVDLLPIMKGTGPAPDRPLFWRLPGGANLAATEPGQLRKLQAAYEDWHSRNTALAGPARVERPASLTQGPERR